MGQKSLVLSIRSAYFGIFYGLCCALFAFLHFSFMARPADELILLFSRLTVAFLVCGGFALSGWLLWAIFKMPDQTAQEDKGASDLVLQTLEDIQARSKEQTVMGQALKEVLAMYKEQDELVYH